MAEYIYRLPCADLRRHATLAQLVERSIRNRKVHRFDPDKWLNRFNTLPLVARLAVFRLQHSAITAACLRSCEELRLCVQ